MSDNPAVMQLLQKYEIHTRVYIGKKERKKYKNIITSVFSGFLLIISTLSSSFSVYTLLRAKISINVYDNEFSKATRIQLFILKNEGYFSLYNIDVSCDNRTTATGSHVVPVKILASSESVARPCFVRDTGQDNEIVDVSVSYKSWIPLLPSKVKATFRGFHGKNGYFFVPDTSDATPFDGSSWN